MPRTPYEFTVQHGRPGRGRASVAPLAGLSAPIIDEEPDTITDEVFDPSAHTVADVQSYVGDGHADEIDAILEAERVGQARTTLIDWLESHAGTPTETS